MDIEKKSLELKINSILGVTAPFAQGGSIRLTVPKRMVQKYGLKRKLSQGYFGFVFVETNKGVLLVSLNKAVNPISIKDALKFAGISSFNNKDLKLLFEEAET